MKGKSLYLFAIGTLMTIASCKKSNVEPIAPVEPPKVEVIPEDPNYETVASTIEVTAVLGAAKFDWINAAKKPVYLKFKYVQDAVPREVIVATSSEAAGTLSIPIAALTTFNVFISNVGGTAVSTRAMAILPILYPEVKLPKIGWNATASSEINDEDNELNGAANIVDDVKTMSLTSSSPSFWQTDYNVEPMLTYPHWLIVDMKTAQKITKIGLNAHTDPNQGFNTFRIEGSLDGVDFEDIGGSLKNFAPSVTTEQSFAVVTPVAIRYVKITLLSGSDYPCLANFEAYVRK
ncbi:discoidin domain-containing protein [Pedobacter gandavensis]|uniref:discoidin domain-containing protein n=1 Tax=Pedobacter gandavensis TaxID=2679963 RepID=UPI00292D7F12|nr:discoidin domain-containing protein [Pedobacter gandavensis]